MNILYINHYAGSPVLGMEFRPYYFAREWTKMGHHVTVIAGDYSHLRIKNPDVKKDFQKETIDGGEIMEECPQNCKNHEAGCDNYIIHISAGYICRPENTENIRCGTDS